MFLTFKKKIFSLTLVLKDQALLKIGVCADAGKITLTSNASASRSSKHQHLSVVIRLIFLFSCLHFLAYFNFLESNYSNFVLHCCS